MEFEDNFRHRAIAVPFSIHRALACFMAMVRFTLGGQRKFRNMMGNAAPRFQRTDPLALLRIIPTSVAAASTGRASVTRLVKRSSCAAARRPGLCESSRGHLSLRYPDESRGRPRAGDCNRHHRHGESDDLPLPCFVESRGHRANCVRCARPRTDGDHDHPATNDGLRPVRMGGEKSSVTVDANCDVRTTAVATWRAGGKRMRNRGNGAACHGSLRQSRKGF